MQLSKNFTSKEFACPCCGKCELDLTLIAALQTLRDAIERPMIITSGYRCEEHNKQIKGVPGSYHTKGKAADFKIPGMTPDEILDFIEKVLPDIAESCGIGVYSSWTHLDIRGKRARWVK